MHFYPEKSTQLNKIYNEKVIRLEMEMINWGSFMVIFITVVYIFTQSPCCVFPKELLKCFSAADFI